MDYVDTFTGDRPEISTDCFVGLGRELLREAQRNGANAAYSYARKGPLCAFPGVVDAIVALGTQPSDAYARASGAAMQEIPLHARVAELGMYCGDNILHR